MAQWAPDQATTAQQRHLTEDKTMTMSALLRALTRDGVLNAGDGAVDVLFSEEQAKFAFSSEGMLLGGI